MRRNRDVHIVAVGLLVYGVVVLYPVLPVIIKGLNVTYFDILINSRRMKILLRSLIFSVGVATFVSSLGFFVASAVTLQKKYLGMVFGIMLSFVLLPGYIQAMGWTEFGAEVLKLPVMNGPVISLLVQSMYMLPIALLVCYICIQQTSEDYFNVSWLDASDLKGGFQTIVRLNRKSVVIAGGIVFLLCLNEYSIPSLFAYNTYPVELMTMFSSGMQIEEVVTAALPIVVLSTVILLTVFKMYMGYFEGQDLTDGMLNIYIDKHPMMIGSVIIVFVIQVLIPGIWLIAGIDSMKDIVDAIQKSWTEIRFSFLSAGVAAVVMVMISLLLAYGAMLSAKFRSLMTMMMVMQFAIPGTVHGLITVGHYNVMPDWIYYSMLPTVHLYILRFLPLVYLIILMGLTALSKEDLYAVQLETTSHTAVITGVIMPQIRYVMLIAGVIGFALSMGELSGSILTVPPGNATLTVTIYNYMHYGNGQVVLGLALFTLFFDACLLGSGWVMLRKISNIHRLSSSKR